MCDPYGVKGKLMCVLIACQIRIICLMGYNRVNIESNIETNALTLCGHC